jgi:hypothetical protein
MLKKSAVKLAVFHPAEKRNGSPKVAALREKKLRAAESRPRT